MRPSGQEPAASPDLTLAFAPLHKAAFGAAIGTVTAFAVFSMTAIVLLRGLDGEFPLRLLGVYFSGYSVTWWGAVIGAFWGGVGGFVFGWFGAFCRNAILAISLFSIRTRAELAQTQDFLDHI